MVYQLEAEKKFPRRVRITERTVGWIDGEVQAWLAGRIEQHRVRRSG
jgi:predicted DNA-binding transcriptional regulator AlpA